MVSHYRVLSTLGQGGMGRVYLASDDKLKRRVAIKVLLPEALHDRHRVQRFLNEARMAAGLSHPNIITIFEIGEDQGSPFLVMEYIEGQNLRSRLRQGPLDIASTLRIARRIAEALGVAHLAGVIHRDIKPENVMLAHSGAVKVLDFGLAYQNPFGPGSSSDSTAPTVTNLTAEGTVVGTLRYMSPEQLRGRNVDARSDLFGAGILMYELLTGHPPFEAPTWADFAHELLSADPRPMSERGVPVPQQLESVVRKCMAKDPGQRYQSAEELSGDLASLARDWESGALTGLKPSEQTPAHSTQRTARWLLAAVAAFAVLAFALAALWLFYRPHPKRFDSVAVLPFANKSGDPSLDYVVEGLSASLRRDLSRIKGLTVSSAEEVQKYRQAGVVPRVAAKELHVNAVLAGEVSAVQNQIQLIVGLTAAANGQSIWTQSYTLPRTEMARLADRLWVDTSDELGQRLENANKRRQVNSEAYDLYLRGELAMGRRGRSDVRQAANLFQESIEKDREFGPAYAGLAEAYVLIANFGAQPPVTVLLQAKEAARRAIELDPQLAEAHLSYAMALGLRDFDWSASEREFRRSLELNPRNALAHAWFSLTALIPLKRFDEASLEAQRAVTLEPQSISLAMLQATTLYLSRHYDEAIGILNRIQAAPFQGTVNVTKALCLNAEGRTEDALELLTKTAAPEILSTLKSTLGYTYSVAHKRAEAETIAREMETDYRQVYSSPCNLASIYVQLRRFDRAMQWLDECRAQDDLSLRFLGVDPRFDLIRGDSRFRNLLEQLALK